jgi:2-oxoglutarate ferredoxin oxidoreductase subunit alpha
MEQVNLELQKKYRKIEENEVRFEEINTEDADILLVAYGLSARICQKVIELGREKGIKLGLLRPITLYPFPTDALASFADKVNFYLCLEMNAGQMVEDVRLAVNGKKPVYHYGRMGGIIPTPEEVLNNVEQLLEKQMVTNE